MIYHCIPFWPFCCERVTHFVFTVSLSQPPLASPSLALGGFVCLSCFELLSFTQRWPKHLSVALTRSRSLFLMPWTIHVHACAWLLEIWQTRSGDLLKVSQPTWKTRWPTWPVGRWTGVWTKRSLLVKRRIEVCLQHQLWATGSAKPSLGGSAVRFELQRVLQVDAREPSQATVFNWSTRSNGCDISRCQGGEELWTNCSLLFFLSGSETQESFSRDPESFASHVIPSRLMCT